MAQVNLLEMEASDMVDVLHFQFEEYFTFFGEEHAASVNGIRKSLWTTMYGETFKYEVKMRSSSNTPRNFSASDSTFNEYESLNSVDPFSPRERSENGEEIKPFFPATEFNPDSANPFPGLDGPLG